MISAFYLIASERPRRIALSYGGEYSCHEICGTVREARYRIEEIVETHARTIPVLSRRRLSLDHQPKHIVEPVTAVLRAWNDAAGQWTSERYAHLCTAVPLRDLVVVRNRRGTDQMIYHHWGDSGDIFGSRWAQIAGGKDVEDQPFPELGKRMAWLYRRTLADAEPDLKEVDIALSSAGCTISHDRYARLLLPWSEPRGDRYVTLIRINWDTRRPNVSTLTYDSGRPDHPLAQP